MKGLSPRWIVIFSALLLLLGESAALTAATPLRYEGTQVYVREECQGKFEGRRPTPAELKQVLSDHTVWAKAYRDDFLEGLTDFRRANLCGANLSRADLRDANLSGAMWSAPT